MFDYFRLDPNWPGNVKMQGRPTAKEKAERIEDATLAKIRDLFPDYNVEERFIPYIEMHEFEALLFSEASILANKIGVDTGQIEDILDEFGEPEEINDGQDTAPSFVATRMDVVNLLPARMESERYHVFGEDNRNSDIIGTHIQRFPGS